jgi:hypothetical protein
MTGVWLDPAGRLLRYQHVPPAVDRSEPRTGAPDWSALFHAAGLDMADFSPTSPALNPLLDCNTRAAWLGVRRGPVPYPLRVEAGAYRGRPAYFEVVPPWRAGRWIGGGRSSDPWSDIFFLLLLLVLLVGGAFLARRNLRLGRGDRQGATRIAAFVFIAYTLWWVLGAHHVLSLGEVWLLLDFSGFALFVSAAVWIVYLALEPAARRLWPHILVPWSRLVSGRLRDPAVGRDILIGAVAGLATRAWWALYDPVLAGLGRPASPPALGSLESLTGVRETVSQYFAALGMALYLPIGWLFLLLLARYVLKRQWAATLALILLVMSTVIPGARNPLIFGLFMAAAFGVWLWLLVRFGVLCAILWALFFWADSSVVLTLEPTSWFFGRSLLTLLVLAALAGYGFWIACLDRLPLKGSIPSG